MKEPIRQEALDYLISLKSKVNNITDEMCRAIDSTIIVIDKSSITEKLIIMEEKGENIFKTTNGMEFDHVVETCKESDLLCQNEFVFRLTINSKWKDNGNNKYSEKTILTIEENKVEYFVYHSFSGAFGTDYSNNSHKDCLNEYDLEDALVIFKEWRTRIDNILKGKRSISVDIDFK